MRKLLLLLTAVIMISLSANTAFAAKKPEEKKAHFNSFTGTVKEIRESAFDTDITYVLLVNKEGMEANIVLTEDTYYINDEKIIIGSEVTGYYDANAMMIMIYPPQYVAVAVMVSNSKPFIKVDLFDKDLISADKTLKLKISKDTQVISKDGKEFKGALKNRKLAVFYGTSTRSIPAQTTPDKVVVLSEPLIPDKDKNSYYSSFKGTVTKITNPKDNKNISQLTLKDKDGIEAIFTISKNTYRTNNEKLTIGSEVTGYYDAKVFRIMIYPGQYEAEVLDVERKEYNIKVDYFDNKLISADNSLKINIGKDTELIYKDGAKYNGKPIKSNLVVIYDKSTRSIPAQTEPIKVIVLEESNNKSKKKEPEVKDNKDSKYWKAKVDEWMKLTDELIKNRDKVSEHKDELYRYIWKLIYNKEKSLFNWINPLTKGR